MNKHARAPSKAASQPRGRAVPAPPRVPVADWINQAAYSAADPEVFFPASHEADAEAKQHCVICPVRDECREYALAAGEEFGVWGGLSEDERKATLLDADEREQPGRSLGGAA
jgi:WhiB family transcriptional regulator, redox-sensing transcriptional regulator